MVASVQSSTVAGRNETLPERKLSRPTRLGGSSSGRSAWRGVGTSTSNRAGVTKRARRTGDLLEAGRPRIKRSRPGTKSEGKRPLVCAPRRRGQNPVEPEVVGQLAVVIGPVLVQLEDHRRPGGLPLVPRNLVA